MPRPAAPASSSLLGRTDDVAARLLVRLNPDQTLLARLLEQVGEGAKTVVRLVEARVAALERLLDHRAPDLLFRPALGGERFERGKHLIEGFLLLVVAAARRRRVAALLRRAPLLILGAHEIVVVDELVAVVDEQIGARVLDTDSDHRLRVLAQLRYERREVRVPAHDDEGVDMRLGVAEI